jgi:carotenoid cleavage dioxygenase-like enzyme
MTRRTRAIAGAHAPILDLAITRDHLLLFADGCTGITDHNRDSKITWLSGGMTRHGQVVDAYDDDDSVVVSVADEGLEQWTVTPTANVVRRRRVDGTPQPFVRINEEFAGSPHQYLYGVGGDDATAFGGTTLYKHDAVAGTREDRDFGEGRQAGEFLFVVDPDRNFDEDGGWLLGLVHDETTTTTSLVVLDAADVTGPVVASVRLPRRLPSGLRGLWLPSPT